MVSFTKAVAVALVLGLSRAQPVVVGKTFLASSTDPRPGSTAWSLTSHGIAEKLFTVNQHGEVVGQVAESVNKISEFVWEVRLKEGYAFSDGTSVTASHVAECLAEMNRENPSAQSSLGAMTVTVEGDLKVRIESERPTHVMDAVLAEWAFPVYYSHESSSSSFVFTGPYAVEAFVDNDHIDLVPNEYYLFGATERPETMKVQKFADGHELADAVQNGTVDVGFHLPIDTLPALRNTDGVHVKSFEVGYHYMIHHNTLTLTDRRVREAIDVAIDRTALSQALAGGLGTRSLFPEFTPYFWDESDPHGDKAAAEALLEDAGWLLSTSSTGIRSKDGQDLAVTLVAYPHRPGLVIMQPVIAEALSRLGIVVTSVLTGDDWAETQQIIDDGAFDLLMWAQHTLPAGDPGWFLNTFFRTDGGNNHAAYSDADVDALLDALSVAETIPARVAATRDAHVAILADVPVSNLVTPEWHVGLSYRMEDYEPWGSDYYVIRADSFLTNWPPAEDEPAAESTHTSKKTTSKKDATMFIILFVVAAALAVLLGATLSYVVRRERAGEPVFTPLADQLLTDEVELPKNKDEPKTRL
mmetsp:Transcript_23945/g.77060  ORF Transcript_23945/g.77060 Transcript_23945/m.77060 type:complete len:584 (+) Transcript_23945:52-1803(+)